MGSWNATCVLSNLPVLYSEEVYVFLLEEGKHYNKYIGNHCYANNYYTLLPLYFKGTYNDYGACEDCHGDFLPEILEGIKKNLIELDLGENKYHDIEVKKDKFDIDLLFNADHAGRLFVKPDDYGRGKGETKRRLTHVVARKSVVEGIRGKFKFYNYHIGKNVGYDYIAAEFDKYVEENKDWKSAWLLDRGGSDGFSMPFFDYNGVKGANTLNVAELIFKYINSDKLPQLKEQLCLNVILNRFMNAGRRMWIKPSGEGSKNSEADAQKLMAKLTLAGAKEIENYFEELDNE